MRKRLRSKGLENPTIKYISVDTRDGKKKEMFTIMIDNLSTDDENISKTYNFYRTVFLNFVGENENEIIKRVSEIEQVERDEDRLSEQDDVTHIVMPILENLFGEYLKNNDAELEKQLKQALKIPYSFSWIQAKHARAIPENPLDQENGIILFLYAAEKQDFFKKGSIRKKLELQMSKILLQKEKFGISPNAYYYEVAVKNIDYLKIHKNAKEAITQGYGALLVFDTINKKTLSVHKLI